MRLNLIAATLFSALSLAPAFAADEPSPVTGNLTITSDYRFRGISQTYGLPAVQGGIDYAAAMGLYVGTWMSNVSGNSYPNGAGLEMDIYGGWKKAFGDMGLDLGYIYYAYPGASYNNNMRTSFANQELYGKFNYKWASVKVSYALADFFGINNDTYGGACEKTSPSGYGTNSTACFGPTPGKSNGSMYIDLTTDIPVTEKLVINAHIGRQQITNYGMLSYNDYKIGATYDLAGWGVSAAVIGTDANKGWYYACQSSSTTAKCRTTGDTTLVVSVAKAF